jgi:hypothetical protein
MRILILTQWFDPEPMFKGLPTNCWRRRPLIVAVPGDAAELVTRSGAGVLAKP